MPNAVYSWNRPILCLTLQLCFMSAILSKRILSSIERNAYLHILTPYVMLIRPLIDFFELAIHSCSPYVLWFIVLLKGGEDEDIQKAILHSIQSSHGSALFATPVNGKTELYTKSQTFQRQPSGFDALFSPNYRLFFKLFSTFKCSSYPSFKITILFLNLLFVQFPFCHLYSPSYSYLHSPYPFTLLCAFHA